MLRRMFRAGLVGLVVGLVALGGAFAGSMIAPPPGDGLPPLPAAEEVEGAAGLGAASAGAGTVELHPEDVAGVLEAEVTAPGGGRTPQGTFLVGAARVSLHPAPTLFGGERWQTEGCTVYTEGQIEGDHLVGDPRGWPAASPDCVYLGGFGIGPVRPATDVGPGGVWMRALAVSNGERTFVYVIGDLVGWFARYDGSLCEGCGILDVRQRVADATGIDVSDVVGASTHSHATADTYGGWGGIPRWHRDQIADSAVAAAKQAIATLRPATIETGEVHLRQRNNERRDTYYSTADTGAGWIHARSLPQEQGCPPASRSPRCATEVIATLATYAAHPTIMGSGTRVLHADWPGASARHLETLYGGVGLLFEGGLGNISVRSLAGETPEERAESTGKAIAKDIATDIARGGTVLASNDMAAEVKEVVHPVTTNLGLTTLAAAGLFDREFTPGTPGAGLPGFYHWSKSGQISTTGGTTDPEPRADLVRGCSSAGPTVITAAGAHRIGELMVAFTPGEIFSNISEVIKERASDNAVAIVFGQANDALGYIIQSFEFDELANALTHTALDNVRPPGTDIRLAVGEYEEVFSIDRCFGDHVLETVLESTAELGFGR